MKLFNCRHKSVGYLRLSHQISKRRRLAESQCTLCANIATVLKRAPALIAKVMDALKIFGFLSYPEVRNRQIPKGKKPVFIYIMSDEKSIYICFTIKCVLAEAESRRELTRVYSRFLKVNKLDAECSHF